MATKGEPGSISHGTLRTGDLIESFLSEIERLDPERGASLRKELEDIDPEDDEELSFFMNEDLFDTLDDLAPEGHCFGTHPGDGADFGFWPVEDMD